MRASRIALWIYLALAVATLIVQVPIRLHLCSGTPACALSLVKAPVWAAIWPLYWPAYFGVFQ
jgi:hypothetical protein